MTEEEWLATTDPSAMLGFIRAKASNRKLRIFACACSRKVWDDSWPQRCKDVVLIAERFADGIATDRELNHARTWACQALRRALSATRGSLLYKDRRFEFLLEYAADTALPDSKIPHWIIVHYRWHFYTGFPHDPFVIAMPAVIRDIFGNPFRFVAVDPKWLTSTVVALAEGIYQERAFDRMPILVDALEDAGCDNAVILNHCRQPGEHVRGCWVVDLLLGKE